VPKTKTRTKPLKEITADIDQEIAKLQLARKALVQAGVIQKPKRRRRRKATA
jgi:predicted transcriptional regulator